MVNNDLFVRFCKSNFSSYTDAFRFFRDLSDVPGSSFFKTFSSELYKYGSSFEWQGLTLHENDMKTPRYKKYDESVYQDTKWQKSSETSFTKCVGDASITYTFNSVEDLIKYEKSQN